MAKKILIVEDDGFLQGLCSRKFSAKGYDVFIANDGVEGIKALGDKKTDLILLDLLLPKMDGFEFLKTMQENKDWSKIPVIVFSNLSEEKDINRAKNFGAKEYMIKSNFTLDDLAQKIKTILG